MVCWGFAIARGVSWSSKRRMVRSVLASWSSTLNDIRRLYNEIMVLDRTQLSEGKRREINFALVNFIITWFLFLLQTFEGHESSVLRGEFLSHGMQLITSGGDGLLKLWNIKTSECVSTLDQHESHVWTVVGESISDPRAREYFVIQLILI